MENTALRLHRLARSAFPPGDFASLCPLPPCPLLVYVPRMFSLMTVMLLSAQAGATTCEKLASLALPNTTITSAQLVPAGPFTPPAQGGPPGGPVAAPATGAAAGRGAPGGPGGGR